MGHVLLPESPLVPATVEPVPTRRQLVRRDRMSARLAELCSIGDLLSAAAVRVRAGWCQDAWTAPTREADSGGVCLVSAVRVSGLALDLGAWSQPVNRAVDVAWHTLYGDAEGIRRVAPPEVRLARVRDLARWNDRTGRTVDEVATLLLASAGSADRERARLSAAV